MWADGKADGSPPNNWRSVFGGPAWTLDEPTGQYYLHNFLPQQPDLNRWNVEVRSAFDGILQFWLDRGVAGFRIDVANGLVKDRALRDNPPVTERDDPRIEALGVRSVYNMNRPEVQRRAAPMAEDHRCPRASGDPARGDVGPGAGPVRSVLRNGTDELHLAINFPFLFAELGSGTRAVVDPTEGLIGPAAWPAWGGSNHDVGRFPTRWCGGDHLKARAAMVMLLTLRGTPLLYYGTRSG